MFHQDHVNRSRSPLPPLSTSTQDASFFTRVPRPLSPSPPPMPNGQIVRTRTTCTIPDEKLQAMWENLENMRDQKEFLLTELRTMTVPREAEIRILQHIKALDEAIVKQNANYWIRTVRLRPI